jgi:hypothetical protein
VSPDSEDPRVYDWLAALEQRHLTDLTPSEVARALRALSSCYVERRSRLQRGGALEGAGKRAAFALFYGPVHFFVTRAIVRALPRPASLARIYDFGCGTGAAGAAWTFEAGGHPKVSGADRHPWAVTEANWTYRQLGVTGRAARQDMADMRITPGTGTGVLAAYAINELSDDLRTLMLRRLLQARAQGASVLIVEPISRRATPWWALWEAAFRGAGGRADEWRFPAALPERQRQLAKAAGLNPQELTARTLWLTP